METVLFNGEECSPYQLFIKLIKRANNGIPDEKLLRAIKDGAKGSKHYWDVVQDIMDHWYASRKGLK